MLVILVRLSLVFSRSYCYTVWSAIGISLLSVRPSVRPSVCLWRCALWLSGLVYAAKTYTSVLLAYKFLFVPFDTFAVGCIAPQKVRNAISVDYGFRQQCAWSSKRHASFVINDTRHCTVTAGLRLAGCRHGKLRVPCVDCGLQTQIRSWIHGLTAHGFFYSEVEMLRSQWIALKYCMQYDRLSQQ